MSSKKTIALLLALVMCASLVLASCGSKLSKKDIEADPVGEVAKAAAESSSGIAKSITPLDAIRAAEKKGTVSVTFDNADLGVKIDSKAAYDCDAKRASGSVALGAEGKTFTLKLDVDNSKIALAVPELTDGAYGVDLDTLAEDLKNSELLKSLNVDADEIAKAVGKIVDAVKNLGEDDNPDFAGLEEAIKSLCDDLKARLNKCAKTIERKDVEVGGESAKAFEVVFEIKKTDLVDMLGIVKTDSKSIFDELKKFAAQTAEKLEDIVVLPDSANESLNLDEAFDYDSFAENLDETIEDLKEDDGDATFTLKVYLGEKNAELLFAEFTVTENEDDVKNTAVFTLDLGADPAKSSKITGSVKITTDDEDDDYDEYSEAGFTIERTDDDKIFGVKLVLEGKSGQSESDITTRINLACEFKNDKAAKNYTASMSLLGTLSDKDGEPEGHTIDAILSGDMEYDERNLAFTVDSFKVEIDAADEPEIEYSGIGLSVKISADADIPAMPEFKNVPAMTQADLLSISADAQEKSEDIETLAAKFAEVFEYFFGSLSSPEPDYWESDDGDDWDDWDDDDDEDDGETGVVRYVDICDNFFDDYDYNMDGEINEDDEAEWKEFFKPFGSEYDDEYDYDDDGEVGSDEDKAMYDMMYGFFKDMEVNYNGKYAPDTEDGQSAGEVKLGDEFTKYYLTFNEDYDYDNDGKTGTDGDREEYEEYFMPFVEAFDDSRDYDGDGEANEDDEEYYLYVRRS